MIGTAAAEEAGAEAEATVTAATAAGETAGDATVTGIAIVETAGIAATASVVKAVRDVKAEAAARPRLPRHRARARTRRPAPDAQSGLPRLPGRPETRCARVVEEPVLAGS